jgi:uncharacterized protein involved in cysteine biosynthesis
VISALTRAIGQLPDPAFRSVLLKSFGLTLLVFSALIGGLWSGLDGVDLNDVWWISWLPDFIITALNWLLGGLIVAAALMLFPAIASIFVSLFLDQIVAAVEAKHYPGEPRGPGLTLGQSLKVSVRFSLVVVFVNILALPLYLIPGVNLIVYYLINGHLFGREYFELVALAHTSPREAEILRVTNKGKVFMTGLAIAFLFSIPIVNFFTPIIAAAAMVHVYKGLGRSGVA